MGAHIDFGRVSALPPLALLSQALPRLSRHELEAVVELLIDRLDELDPDPDLEPNGDELDGTGAEDEEQTGSEGAFNHPGCPISDPAEPCDEDNDDDREPWQANILPPPLPVIDLHTRRAHHA